MTRPFDTSSPQGHPHNHRFEAPAVDAARTGQRLSSAGNQRLVSPGH